MTAQKPFAEASEGLGAGAEIPDDIIGTTIVGFGTLPTPRAVSGGGLVIDYGEIYAIRRIVIASSDIGQWVEYIGKRSALPNPA